MTVSVQVHCIQRAEAVELSCEHNAKPFSVVRVHAEPGGAEVSLYFPAGEAQAVADAINAAAPVVAAVMDAHAAKEAAE